MENYDSMINANIKELLERLFDDKEMGNINQIIKDIKGNRENSLIKLADVLGMKPKRPLYYIAMEIDRLPEYGTRNIIRYSGDYIDQLVRFTLEDRRFLSRWFLSPLGPNIKKLKKYIDTNLYDELVLFNKIYAQGKHDFHLREDKCFFNYEDAIYMIYITKKLAQKILPLSERARDYNDQGPTAYRYCPINKI